MRLLRKKSVRACTCLVGGHAPSFMHHADFWKHIYKYHYVFVSSASLQEAFLASFRFFFCMRATSSTLKPRRQQRRHDMPPFDSRVKLYIFILHLVIAPYNKNNMSQVLLETHFFEKHGGLNVIYSAHGHWMQKKLECYHGLC